MKICTKCGEEKPLSDFYVTKNRHGNPMLYSRCKLCHQAQIRDWQARNREKVREYSQRTAKKYALRNRARTYGLTEEEHDAMLKAQDGRCAICRRLPGKRALAIDHDHETKQVRELLCGACNQGLGYFGENTDLMERAIQYLRKHHQQRLRIIK